MNAITKVFERVFDIRTGEWRRLLLLYGFAFMLNVTIVWGQASSEALFLKPVGVDKLPIMFIADAILNIITLIIYTAFADRISNRQLMVTIPIIGAVVLIAARIGIEFEFQPTYFLLYLSARVLQVIISIHAWTYIADFYDTRTAKRHFPFIASGSRTSGIIAGLLILPIATTLGTKNLIVAWAIALVGAAYIAWDTPRREPLVTEHEVSENKQGFFANIKEGAGFVSQSNFLRLMAAGAFLSTLLLYLLDYEAQVFFANRFQDANELAAFYGFLGAVANVIALPIQMFILSRIVTRLGVGNSNLIFPSIAGISYALLLGPSILSASLARVNQSALRSAFRTPIDSLLYNAVPVSIKGRARAFNGLLIPTGTLVAGLILIFPLKATVELVNDGETPLGPLQVIGLTVGIIYIYVAYRLRRAYSQSLTSLLAEDELNLFRLADMDQDQPREVTIKLLQERITQTEDSALLVFLSEMLNDLQGRSAIPFLQELAEKHPGEVRAGIIDLIGNYWQNNDQVRQMCVVGVTDKDVRVRQAAIRALVGDGAEGYAEADDLLDLFLYLLRDDNEDVQAMVIPPLIASGDFYYLAPGVEHLSRWISAEAPPNVRVKGLTVLASTGSERMVRTLVRYLEDKEAMVRRQAASLIDNLTANTKDMQIRALALDTLSSLLDDTDETVRLAAVDGLGHFTTPEATNFLMQSLGDRSFVVRRQASAILSKQVNEELEASLELENQFLAESAAFILSSSNHTRARRRAIELMDKLVADTYALMAQRVPLVSLKTPGVQLLCNTLHEQEIELMDRFFWLLGSLSTEVEAHNVRNALRDKDKIKQSNAIEALESLTTAGVANRVAPLYTGADLTSQIENWRSTLQLADITKWQTFFQLWPHLRMASDITKPARELYLPDDDGWLRAVAIYALAEIEEEDLKDAAGNLPISKDMVRLAVKTSFKDEQPLVRETARIAWQHLKTEGETLEINMEGQMLSTIEKVIFLKEVPFFAGMSISQLRVLASISEEEEFQAEQVIFSEGEFGDALYVIIEGEVALQKRTQRGRTTNVKRLTTQGNREYFAEMSIFDDKPHQYDAVAIKATRMLLVRRSTLTALINHQPDLSVTLLRSLSERLREYSDVIADKSDEKPEQLVNLFDRLS